MYDAPHLLLGESIARHHLQQPVLRIVADGSEVCRQLVQLIVTFALRRLTTHAMPVLADDRGIGDALELAGELGLGDTWGLTLLCEACGAQRV